MINKRQLGAVLAIAVLVVSAGGALAAAPTIDTETTNTSSTSEVTDGTTIVNFQANSSNTSVLQASYDSQNPKVEVLNADNETVKTYTASDMNQTGNGTSTYYYNTTISHDVWNNVEISPGQNVTVHLRLTNNTQAESPDTTNVTVHLDGAKGRTVRVVGSSLSDDVFSTASTGTFALVGTLDVGFLGWGQDTSTYEADSGIPINGTNSTVELHYANDSAVSSLATVADELDTNAWAKSIIVQSDSGPIKTYIGEAPDDVDSSATYAVWESSANDLVIHTGDNYEGETEISGLSVNGNAGFIDQIRAYGFGSALPDLNLGLMAFGGSSLSLGGAFLFFRVDEQEAS